MMHTHFIDWKASILDPTPPPCYQVGGGFEKIPLEPNRIIMIGGPPGYGKTALVMQWTWDALRYDKTLKALICNVEMSPDVLWTRELSRVSTVPLSEIQTRGYLKTRSYTERVRAALVDLGGLMDRVRFVEPPFTLQNVATFDDDFDASIIVLDYIQRISATSEQSIDLRLQSNLTMDMVRRFADTGKAIIAVASVARDKNSNGKAYSNLGLGSFKESGELEFGADCCYLLQPNGDDGEMILKNPKSRHWQPKDIAVRFDRRHQRFTASGEREPND